jgi:hypothetical protein
MEDLNSKLQNPSFREGPNSKPQFPRKLPMADGTWEMAN